MESSAAKAEARGCASFSLRRYFWRQSRKLIALQTKLLCFYHYPFFASQGRRFHRCARVLAGRRVAKCLPARTRARRKHNNLVSSALINRNHHDFIIPGPAPRRANVTDTTEPHLDCASVCCRRRPRFGARVGTVTGGPESRKGSRLLATLNVNKNPFAQINYGTGKDVSDEDINDAKPPLQIKWHNGSYLKIPVRK